MAEINNKEMGQNDQKLDAIKEIIFGEQIKEYDIEFKELRDELARQKAEFKETIGTLKKEMKDLIKTTEKEIAGNLAEVKQETLKTLEQLDNSKANRHTLGEMLQELGQSLKK